MASLGYLNPLNATKHLYTINSRTKRFNWYLPSLPRYTPSSPLALVVSLARRSPRFARMAFRRASARSAALDMVEKLQNVLAMANASHMSAGILSSVTSLVKSHTYVTFSCRWSALAPYTASFFRLGKLDSIQSFGLKKHLVTTCLQR